MDNYERQQITEADKPSEPSDTYRGWLYALLVLYPFLWWGSFMVLGQLFGAFGYFCLFWFCAFYVFIVPALLFAVVVLLRVKRRMFKIVDVVVVLLVVASMTAFNAMTVIRMLP